MAHLTCEDGEPQRALLTRPAGREQRLVQTPQCSLRMPPASAHAEVRNRGQDGDEQKGRLHGDPDALTSRAEARGGAREEGEPEEAVTWGAPGPLQGFVRACPISRPDDSSFTRCKLNHPLNAEEGLARVWKDRSTRPSSPRVRVVSTHGGTARGVP